MTTMSCIIARIKKGKRGKSLFICNENKINDVLYSHVLSETFEFLMTVWTLGN